MGKGHKKDKMSYEQKKEAFWQSLISQKLSDVRAGLVNTGFEAQTRNDEGYTCFMVAALNGKNKSMDVLLDYFERRRELRRKGWIDLKDDDGRTTLMMACASGNEEIVESLLDKGANATIKDFNGLTARDHAVARKKTAVVELLDAWFAESEEEVGEDGEVINDGLTSTQRNKMKKRQLQEQERRGQLETQDADDGSASDAEPEGPRPVAEWPEIQKLEEAEKMLRPIHELNVVRDEPDAKIDPALWFQKNINRLDLRMGQALTEINGVAYLRQLQTLILNGNALQSLPDEIGKLKHLKVLEVNNNQLKELPSSIGNLQQLETIDLSHNHLQSLEALHDLPNIATLNVSFNQIESLDLDFDKLSRLHDLIISNNKIDSLTNDFGKLAGLLNLIAENNEITELPFEITQLKKINILKLDNNPIADPKVRKMLQNDQRKDLWKYLEKTGSKSSGDKKSKGGKKKSKKGGDQNSDDETTTSAKPPQPPKASSNDPNDDDDDGESVDSFDITMDEL